MSRISQSSVPSCLTPGLIFDNDVVTSLLPIFVAKVLKIVQHSPMLLLGDRV